MGLTAYQVAHTQWHWQEIMALHLPKTVEQVTEQTRIWMKKDIGSLKPDATQLRQTFLEQQTDGPYGW
jgi:hypothetical protein